MEPADAPQLPAGEVHAAFHLTHAARPDPAVLSVPSSATIIATFAATGVLLLIMTLSLRLAADRIGPPAPGADPCRWLAAMGLTLLAAAATTHVGAG